MSAAKPAKGDGGSGVAGDAATPAKPAGGKPGGLPAPPRKGFKTVLLGDASVGKSSILLRFLQNKFSDGIETTVGAAFSTKTIESGKRQVKFEIWDTAGQERFKSLAPMYYRGASGVVIVYDQTVEGTFERAKEWVRQIQQNTTNPNIIIALAANKMDLAESRAVPIEKAEDFAEQEGLLFLETSAKSGKNVVRLFESIAEHLPEEPFVPEQRGLIVASTAPTGSGAPTPESKKGSGCCG